ncbi:late embryogenesis abundant protein At5g17165 [Fagus crenata]
MAANSSSRGVALSLSKRVVNRIWNSNSTDPANTLRRAAHTSVYDKNLDDHTPPNVVPDHVIPPHSDKYWEPHPKTGVFGPPAGQSTAGGERTANGGEDSVLEQKAWFRPTGLEDLEKPHAH